MEYQFNTLHERFKRRKAIAVYAFVIAAAFALTPVIINLCLLQRINWAYFAPQCIVLAALAASFREDILFVDKLDRAFENDDVLNDLGGESGINRKYYDDKPMWIFKLFGVALMVAKIIYVFTQL